MANRGSWKRRVRLRCASISTQKIALHQISDGDIGDGAVHILTGAEAMFRVPVEKENEHRVLEARSAGLERVAHTRSEAMHMVLFSGHIRSDLFGGVRIVVVDGARPVVAARDKPAGFVEEVEEIKVVHEEPPTVGDDRDVVNRGLNDAITRSMLPMRHLGTEDIAKGDIADLDLKLRPKRERTSL